MTTVDARTTRRRRWVGAALTLAVVAVLVAIAVERSGGEKVVNGGGATKIMVGEKAASSGGTRLEGRLADVGGCLGVTPDGVVAGTARVVVWPHGTNVDRPDPLRVKIDGRVHAVGDHISVRGRETGPLATSSSFYQQVPKACRTAPGFVAAGS